MSINDISIDDFKEYFFRDFAFLPLFSIDELYSIDDVVCYTDNKFYKSLVDDNDSLPTDDEKWATTSDKKLNYLLDADVEKALGQAKINFNSNLFDDEGLRIAFLYITAFYMVYDIQTSNLGLSGSFKGFTSSKSVDGVSESYAIPDWMLNNATLGLYGDNPYGRKYLSILAPYLVGNIILSTGGTTNG